MPELPEVETIRQSLQKAIAGKKIKNIEVRKAKIFQGNTQEVIGETIEGVERRGKMLIIRLSGDKSLLVHFKLTGQFVWVPKAGESVTVLPAKTTHVIFEINGGKLFYNDLRQFGWIKIIQKSKIKNQKELATLGLEPFDKEFTTDYLKQIFVKTSKPIKLVLMDQEKIAGIGNIYANEALFEAGVRPAKRAKELSNLEIKQLKEAIIKVLEEGLKYGGSSAADEAYVKPTGEPGEYQKHFRVYQRAGEKCPQCGSIIKRINLAGRGTFYCQKCQK